jgi:Protein of unknown function DUF45
MFYGVINQERFPRMAPNEPNSMSALWSLISNRSLWFNPEFITSRNWHHKNVVLIGDALKTVHPSIGSRASQITLAIDLDDECEGFQDFVIVHELLHLKVPNHGRLFKALMSAHIPKWRAFDASRHDSAVVSPKARAAAGADVAENQPELLAHHTAAPGNSKRRFISGCSSPTEPTNAWRSWSRSARSISRWAKRSRSLIRRCARA